MMIRIGIEILEHTVLTKYSVNKGLQVFGQGITNAIITNMQHLNYSEGMETKKTEVLTHKERNEALEYLMFSKKNRCGKIKCHGCKYGINKRVYRTKEKRALPPFQQNHC